MSRFCPELNVADFNARTSGYLPGHLDIELTALEPNAAASAVGPLPSQRPLRPNFSAS
ncbi:MAG: hypothetical protein LBV49_07265 [Azonexus sp.]|nr:hypothetical protein [Azonexus sp.]